MSDTDDLITKLQNAANNSAFEVKHREYLLSALQEIYTEAYRAAYKAFDEALSAEPDYFDADEDADGAHDQWSRDAAWSAVHKAIRHALKFVQPFG